jgi:predicted ATPase/DNA-binding SARP family transcriptional activator
MTQIMNRPWQINLFGGLQANDPQRTVARFQTYKTGALLGYLAYHLHRCHPREALAELFWPDVDPRSGLLSLRVALNSLRRQLEPPGMPRGGVLVAERATAGINPIGATTDVAEYAALLRQARAATILEARQAKLTAAVALYRGELLADYYEDWILPERLRLAAIQQDALRDLALLAARRGETALALDYALSAISVDPLNEESQRLLIRLYLEQGRVAEARAQYLKLAQLLQEQLGEQPSAETRRLLARSGRQEDAGEIAAPGHLPSTGIQHADRSQQMMASHLAFPPQETPPAAADKPAPDPRPLPARLPLQFTRFFGRTEEIERLLALLDVTDPNHPPATRLVTLTGSGGAGKTRLAIEVAGRLQAQAPDAVWFVSLADLFDPQMIPAAIAAALQLPATAESDPFELVVRFFNSDRAQGAAPPLLALDNLEQLLGDPHGPNDGAAIVRRLLVQAPSLRCLVTSRRRLGLAGEQAFPVSPLPVPQSHGTKREEGTSLEGGHVRFALRKGQEADTVGDLEPAALLSFPSVRLFVDRAQLIRADFQITPRNAAAIAAICNRLEGIPLAIELIAAWIQTLSPAQMAARLTGRSDLLVSRGKDLHERHRTLRSALQWSYRLLSPPLQSLFAQLSVFRGGWTLEAAQAVYRVDIPRAQSVAFGEASQSEAAETVTNDEASPGAPWLLEFLAELQSASLVLAEEVEGEMRYRMLETLREYAEELLAEEADRRAAQRRHANYFLQIVETPQGNNTTAQMELFLRLDLERDNLRAALDYCRQDPASAEVGLRLVSGLWWYWLNRGYHAEGRAQLETALAHSEAQEGTAARARALYCVGGLALQQGDYVATKRYFEASLTLRRGLGDRNGVAQTLNGLGLVHAYQGDYEAALPLYMEALATKRELGDIDGIAAALNNLAMLAFDNGDYVLARAHYREALEYYRRIDKDGSIANTLLNLGAVYAQLDEFQAAHEVYAEALQTFRLVKDQQGLAYTLVNLGELAAKQGHHRQAGQCYTEALALVWEQGDLRAVATALEGVALSQIEEGQIGEGVRRLGTAAELRQQINCPLPPNQRAAYDALLARARASLGVNKMDIAWESGRVMPIERVAAQILAPLNLIGSVYLV